MINEVRAGLWERLKIAWLLVTSRQYFVVVDMGDRTMCAGANTEVVREAETWFKRVKRLAGVSHRNYIKSIMEV